MARALTNVRRAADKAASAFRSRDDAIRQAHTGGHSTRAIAKAAGISHQRVHQIIHRH